MKKYLIPILLFVIAMPFMVDAKEYCKVVSGNGKDIGSEISCGTEHFYILDSKDDEIKMLAKYNLHTGISIYKEKIEREEGDNRTDQQYCSDLALSKGGKVKSDSFYDEPGYCFYTISLDRTIIETINYSDFSSADSYCKSLAPSPEEKYKYYAEYYFLPVSQNLKYSCKSIDNLLLQDETAKSAHWDEDGNYLYPQVGDIYLHNDYRAESEYSTSEIDSSTVYENSKFQNYIVKPSTYNLGRILNQYKESLSSLGYNVNDVGMLPVSELDRISRITSNKPLPINQWAIEYEIINSSGGFNSEIAFGDLKPYIPKDYSWLYSTTYWNNTVFKDPSSFQDATHLDGYYYVFVAEQGKICGAGFSLCAPETTLGCGVRPTITIPSNELQYLIKTETDGNGTIDVIDNSLGGETIQFKLSVNKGYKLGSIVIKTDSGEEIEFSEGNITNNDDGTLSIDKNKFTMPFENVTIQAKFELESILKNPKTGDKVLFIIFILVASIGIGTFIYKKKESRYNI